jgi:mono/diheme cytochrome c family protein
MFADRRAVRSRLLFLIIACLAPMPAAASTAAEGEAIYRQGMLAQGVPVRAEGAQGARIEGRDAACVNCHRRSGLGGAEGRYVITPIAGNYLFASSGDGGVTERDMMQTYGVGHRHGWYSDTTLARAIREGVDADGNELNRLMPRFKLDDAAMGSLTAYLRGLAPSQSPGVADDTLHFATIITPDADPVKRRGMLDVLEHFFAAKNEFFRGGQKRMHAARGVGYRVNRLWQLHVWELHGAPETWERQLHERLAAEPVFAVISGIGGKTWAPVHQFCEHDAIPCLFPNVDVPVIAENDFYSVYFSKGVLLEAELLAKRLAEARGQTGLRRVIQIFRQADAGEDAAAALSHKLAGGGLEMVNYPLTEGDARRELADVLKGADQATAVVLWLRPRDLEQLPPDAPNRLKTVFMSGLMGGMDHAAFPAAWRGVMHMTYPIDLPERRKVRMNYASAWLQIQHVPIVDERTQADTYLACGILSESLGMMLDSFVRDYLVERTEDMLDRMPVTGLYPRLGLAPGQRFASKGGYLVRFSDKEGAPLVADGDWTVPQ